MSYYERSLKKLMRIQHVVQMKLLRWKILYPQRLLSNQVTTCIALKDFVQSVQLTGESIQLVPCLLECSKFGNQWKGH
ncbi:hypothetical protein Pyn_08568 [Prunus yedoensis var. nudiflora]|uniref:Uncharacterized protein n=1 Tax=Prunus yedoensis var. nudiflora TaxID=2094558 RepID=A0A315AVN3_PRUYE|nr:hypothetical protein Pyn_08568 [Prunus yedoensis var. nudiflora]